MRNSRALTKGVWCQGAIVDLGAANPSTNPRSLANGATAVQIALIWLAHIGMDRMLGYGLKYPTGFKDSHLQRV